MKFIFMFFLLLVFNQANAAFYSGEELLKICKVDSNSSKSFNEGECKVYIEGIYDAYVSFNKWGLIADTLCLTDGVSSTELVRASTKYMEDQPEKMNEDASGLVLNALADAFPCK